MGAYEGKYRQSLPQLSGGTFLADGGLETTLIFHEGVELPHFAAFHLLATQEGRATLKRYYEPYLKIARENGFGFILDSASWRSNADWGARLGYSKEQLAAVNRDSIELLNELRAEYETPELTIVISAAVGPRGDGYDPSHIMCAEEAESYHSEQIEVMAGTTADMIGAFTMTNANEATGITRAARRFDIPVAISFTLETDGRLPTGQSLRSAIEEVDAATANGPAYYMINCAHPTHFEDALSEKGEWLERIRCVRANASRRSHAELNESPDLDDGNPAELGAQYRELTRRLPRLSVLGGCCGTDHRHVACIARSCRTRAS